MKEPENIEKPLAYRLTDRWAPIILAFELIIFWISLFTLYTKEDYLIGVIAPFLISAFAYFSLKTGLSFTFKNPTLNQAGRKFVISFFWFGGSLAIIAIPILMIREVIENPTEFSSLLLSSMAGLSICLGASHSWKYSFKI